MKEAQTLQTCDPPVCAIQIIDIISFDIVDIYGQISDQVNDNELVYVKGTTGISSDIIVVDQRLASNIGFGRSDINGNFIIPLELSGIDELFKDVTITCFLMKM